MMVAALVQVGLLTKPAWQRLQHDVTCIIQRVFSSSGSISGSGSAVTDVELTETVRGVDAAAINGTETAAQQHYGVGNSRWPSLEGLLPQG
jgi:hypothetical protein